MGFEYVLLLLTGGVASWMCWVNFKQSTTSKNSHATYSFLISLLVVFAFVIFTLWTTTNTLTQDAVKLPTVEEKYATKIKEFTDQETFLSQQVPRDEYEYQKVIKEKEEFLQSAEETLVETKEYKTAESKKYQTEKQQTAVALMLGVYDISVVILSALRYSSLNKLKLFPKEQAVK